ncbi:hypothetical protein [Nocardioides sp. 1609]|uniref:hypothetical protein n=1 Tax=Nocardioides sp. 1609 TaxID=2508327 RepID=UPI00106F4315|nr:hypothetical protein [Nocardioides sp. 1609]
MRRDLILHIGASKTGTSALQRGLFDSAPQLEAAGIGLPYLSRDESLRGILRPFGWRTARGFAEPFDEARVARIGRRLRRTPGDRLLVTNEDLCEARVDRIQRFVDIADDAGLDTRVVLSVRVITSVVPSEWQQFLKHRMTLDYPTFLERLHTREGPWAEHFWQRQDVAATLQRWGSVVGTDRLDVVVTPDRATDPDGLYRHFGALLGFDPTVMSWPTDDINASWGYTEAEVYRRANAALGSRLPSYETDYVPGLRTWLVRGALKRGASARITVPPDAVAWLRDVAHGHVAAVRDVGIRAHGDLDALVPDADAGSPLPELRDDEIAEAAISTIADMAVMQLRARRREESGAAPRRAADVRREQQQPERP